MRGEKRYVMFPIKEHEEWELYKKAFRCFWTPEELTFDEDVRQYYEDLNDNERHFISHVLAFFAASDGIVNENLVVNMMNLFDQPEIKCFYGFQIMMENVHSEVYSEMIQTYVPNIEDQSKLFRAIETMPCVGKKAKWALNWINKKNATMAERLVSFAAVEGIFFSGSFCAIFWLKKRNLMPGLCQSNELISRDEGLHCDFACHLFKKYTDRPDLTRIITEAVDIEKEFIINSLPVSLIGMNATLMSEYIECCADRLLVELGFERYYNTKNPFPWMELISLNGKTNFFEKKVTEYAVPSSKRVFSLKEDF